MLNVKASRSSEFMFKGKSQLDHDNLSYPNEYQTDDKIIHSYFKEKYEKFNDKKKQTNVCKTLSCTKRLHFLVPTINACFSFCFCIISCYSYRYCKSCGRIKNFWNNCNK